MPGLGAGSLLGAFAAGGEHLFEGKRMKSPGSFQNTSQKAVLVGRCVCRSLGGDGVCRSRSPVQSGTAACKPPGGCEGARLGAKREPCVRAEPPRERL